MTWRDLSILAWRGVTRRPVRSALTAAGLAVAVAGMVVFLSLGSGLRAAFTAQFRSVGPDVQLTLNGTPGGLLPPPNLPASAVAAVRAAAAPLGVARVTPVVTVLRQALDPAQSAVYYGVPAAQGIGALFEGLRAARGREFRAGDEGRDVAVLGRSAARNAGVDVGGRVEVLGRSLRVVGVLEGGQGLNDTFTFVPLATLQRAAGTGDRVSLIAVTLRDPGRAAPVAARLTQATGLEGQTRGDVLAVVDRALRVTDAARVGLSVVALIVGGLAAANTAAMGVSERVAEFGTLRALGARPAVVRTLVLLESALLAAAAGVAGVSLGVAGNVAVNAYSQGLAGIDAAVLTPGAAAVAVAVSAALGLVAAAVPARAAGRVPVVDALRRA